jgi:hypothetical protein
VTLGLNHGEIILVALIFGLVYTAGLLPKIAAWLTGEKKAAAEPRAKRSTD